MTRAIRVLVAKPGLDGHDRGAKVVAKALRDAGMEVIYTGLHQTAESIVNSALDEDVDVIGISLLSGAHNMIVPKILKLLKSESEKKIWVLLGGIIPAEDQQSLLELGVDGIFTAGASLEKMVDFIRTHVQ